MQASRRTIISLSQLLGVVDESRVHVILDKHGLNPQMASFPE
jgi:hypothetical protein